MSQFSVIVPVYNVGSAVRGTLASILTAAQGFSVEVICVDDGSTDESPAILAEIAAGDPRVKVITQKNGGVSAARNRGIEAASGEWMIFVDADDWVRPSYFQTIAEGIAHAPDVDLVGFSMVLVWEGTPAWGETGATWTTIDSATTCADAFAMMSVYLFAYRRDVFGALRFPAYTHGEDLMFVTEAALRSQRCVLTRRPEYAYLFRSDSATHQTLKPSAMIDVITFYTESFRALAASGKQIGRAFVFGRGSYWIEEMPRFILKQMTDASWQPVWDAWLDSMRVAAEIPCLTSHQRAVARRVATAHTRWSVRLHCLLPAWLKRKGLYRKEF